MFILGDIFFKVELPFNIVKVYMCLNCLAPCKDVKTTVQIMRTVHPVCVPEL